ncbi:MAG TPA: TIGR00296 family protein [Methylomirabilota bacterium]|nr:TIGR00296 family protein [Methylomirabilota bacterium]
MKTNNTTEKKAPYLSLDEGQLLVRLARQAIIAHLGNKTIERPHISEALKRKSGVFVTLNKPRPRELRGCIGFPYPNLPLLDATIRAAISSATEDPRFEPVPLGELQNIVLEVTVLTPPETLRFDDRRKLPALITVGRHGLIVEGHGASGLLLPQVAVEWNWDSTDFLSNCCIKAGLPPDCWLLDGTTVKVFEGEIFEEIKPGGEVRRKLNGE